MNACTYALISGSSLALRFQLLEKYSRFRNSESWRRKEMSLFEFEIFEMEMGSTYRSSILSY
jgi:hypothetical protein